MILCSRGSSLRSFLLPVTDFKHKLCTMYRFHGKNEVRPSDVMMFPHSTSSLGVSFSSCGCDSVCPSSPFSRQFSSGAHAVCSMRHLLSLRRHRNAVIICCLHPPSLTFITINLTPAHCARLNVFRPSLARAPPPSIIIIACD